MANNHYLTPEIISKLNNLSIKARFVVEGFIVGLHKSPYHGFSVEFSEHKTKIRRLFFLLVEKQLRRVLKLPLYRSFLLTKENLERIHKSNYLVLYSYIYCSLSRF